jgi:glycerol-3-phosphate O-acyltransferase
MSFRLTEHLYLCQQKASPVTLNSLIAAVLLNARKQSIEMADLLHVTNLLYQYVKKKQNSSTLMQVKPQQILVEKHIEGLNFRMKNKGKKNCVILLDQMKDPRILL